MNFIRFGTLSPQKQVKYGGTDFHCPPCKYGFYAFPEGKIDQYLLMATYQVGNSSNKTAWLKDENGNKIPHSEFFDEYTEYHFKDGTKIRLSGKMFSRENRKILQDEYGIDDLNTILSEESICIPKKEFKPLLKKYGIKKTSYLLHEAYDGIQYMTYFKQPKIFKYDGYIWHHHLQYVDKIDIIETQGSWVKTTMKVYEKAFTQADATDRFNSVMSCEGSQKKLLMQHFKGVPSRHKNCFVSDHYEVFIEKIK